MKGYAGEYNFDRLTVDRDFANLTDYSQKCPDGTKKFFAFIHFTDDSTCMWSNIFASKRSSALKQVMKEFGDCLEYITSINLHESQN